MPTSVVPVVLHASTTAIAAVLAVGGPVSHATELVALGEGSIWDSVQGGLGGSRGAPSIAIRQGGDEVCHGRRHRGGLLRRCCARKANSSGRQDYFLGRSLWRLYFRSHGHPHVCLSGQDRQESRRYWLSLSVGASLNPGSVGLNRNSPKIAIIRWWGCGGAEKKAGRRMGVHLSSRRGKYSAKAQCAR